MKDVLTYEETMDILSLFYKECREYWNDTVGNGREAHTKAVTDVKNVKRNPHVPSGKVLNEKAKKEFVNNIE